MCVQFHIYLYTVHYYNRFLLNLSRLCHYPRNWSFIDSSDSRRSYLSVSTVLLVIFSCFSLIAEVFQAYSRKLEHFTDIRSYVDIGIALLTISFIISIRTNDCYCSNKHEWQLGSALLFLAWGSFILLMRGFPFTAIQINMLLSIIVSFLQVLVLSLLLIVTFGLPLYLLLNIPVSV